MGCTRVQSRDPGDDAGCVRPKSIAEENRLIFMPDLQVADKVERCVDDIAGAKLMSTTVSKKEAGSDTSEVTFFITVNSFLFGFIDDMYLNVVTYTDEAKDPDSDWYRMELRAQSQLRLGSGDFEANYRHVKDMLDCLQ